ncbi:hypothetical protein [Parerythrobacter jejuensis]|uniref:Flagella basal body P-ring formation protein FlgA n=1 Tax=Parerythrobacter jejuensis TaxID=795812 RepID=A0A845AR22_9SPHN|nr:hypothetical protein [Parerythrobacter jejuensis]MXP30562.1 hypothetical protein [Parerythrobacter jejuensis]MXP33322.1 hypothetical protein [Parerythrobacter jejuensis]
MSFALALFAASTGPVAQIPEIRLDSRTIRAGDLADIPGREKVVLGALPQGKVRVEIAPDQARKLVSNRLPGARFTLRYSTVIALTGPAAASRKSRTCFIARDDVPAGHLIHAEDLSPTDCDGREISIGLGYDHARRGPMAKTYIAAGAFLGPVRGAMPGQITKGKILKFRTIDGPVIVEREVEALQPGRPGHKMFVRTQDGDVIAAPLASPAQETGE